MLRTFVKDERGSIGTLLALGALTMIGAVSAGLDYSRMVTARTELANAVDAASLAAGQADSAQAAVVARNVFDANFRNQGSLVSFRAEAFTRGEDEAYRVEAVANVNMAMAQTLGFRTAPVRALSEVTVGNDTDILVSLVLDTTGSMAGSKMSNLKSSATDMVNELFTKLKRANQVKMAVVPFAQYVNVGTANRNAGWIEGAQDYTGVQQSCNWVWNSGWRWQCWNVSVNYTWSGCVGSRSYPLNVRDENYGVRVPAIMNATCTTPLQPLTANRANILTAIGQLPTSGDTYIPAGLMWGWTAVSPREPFNEPTDPKFKTKRYVVLMTDGENTVSPRYPDHWGGDANLANTLTAEVCANIKNDDIEIFTIAFQVSTNTVKSLLRNCATNSDRFYDAADSTQLSSAFKEIAKQMSSLRIVK
ncbi:MAG: VWA domain-containing protein [Beijerinckiaceae bacterium]|nr:VWA domain-containing protein [Beijerinckiaceae bacterium]